MGYGDMGAHDRDEFERSLTDRSYNQEGADLIQTVGEFVGTIAVFLILLYLGLGWVDGKMDWHTQATIFGWLKDLWQWAMSLGK